MPVFLFMYNEEIDVHIKKHANKLKHIYKHAKKFTNTLTSHHSTTPTH
jgi:hypothetical protein